MSVHAKHAAANQITEGIIWKQLLLFFFPILFGTFFQQIYNTADTIVVGRFVGKEALAAVGGSAAQIVSVIVGFFVGISSGASVSAAQFYGARDTKSLKAVLHTAMTFAILAGLAIGAVGIALSKSLLVAMHTTPEALPGSITYLHIYFLGMVFNLTYNVGAGVLRALGDSRRPLYVLIVACLLNIVLDVLFVVVFHLGVAGVAIATISCQGVSALLVFGILCRSEDIYRLEFKEMRIHKRPLSLMLRIGIPAGLESVMYSISNVMIQVFMNRLGTDTVAAWGTLSKIDSLFWMVLNAFGISVTTFVGQNYGAGKYGRMRKSVRDGLIMSFMAAGLIISVYALFGDDLFAFFTTDEAVRREGVHMLHYLMQFYPAYIFIGILSGALRGAGNVLVPMILTCGGVCSIRLCWLIFYVDRHLSVDGIMFSYPLSWCITAVLFILYYLRKFPKEKAGA